MLTQGTQPAEEDTPPASLSKLLFFLDLSCSHPGFVSKLLFLLVLSWSHPGSLAKLLLLFLLFLEEPIFSLWQSFSAHSWQSHCSPWCHLHHWLLLWWRSEAKLGLFSHPFPPSSQPTSWGHFKSQKCQLGKYGMTWFVAIPINGLCPLEFLLALLEHCGASVSSSRPPLATAWVSKPAVSWYHDLGHLPPIPHLLCLIILQLLLDIHCNHFARCRSCVAWCY